MPLPPWEENEIIDGTGDQFINSPVADSTGAAEVVIPQGEVGGNSSGMSDEEWMDQFEQPQGRKTQHASNDRKKRQHLRARYSAIREEAQLAGVIPTTPEGGIRNEVVDPKTQSEQALPNLVGGAIRKGWAVPEESKPRLVDEMISITEDDEESAKTRIAAFNALRLADQQQYERDHPEEIAKKGSHSVSVQANIQAVAVIRQMVESGEAQPITPLLPDETNSIKIEEPDEHE